MQKLNLNFTVKVKLTSYGLEQHKKHWAFFRVNKTDVYTPPKIDSEGYSKFLLWELMSIFGSVLFLGNPNIPFELNEFIYETKEVS